MRASSEDRGIGRDAAVAAAGTALSRITGFVRLAAMAYALGVAETRLADTYNLANTTPNILYELVLGGVLSGVLLRVYIEVRDREGRDEAWRFITRLTNLALIVLGAITLAGIAAAPWVIRAYTFRAPPADRAAQQVLGSVLLMMFIPQILFYGLNTISTAVLRGERRFGVFMFAPVLNNLTVAAMFITLAIAVPRAQRTLEALPREGLLLLGGGTTAGVALLGLVPWVYSRRVGRRRLRRLGLRDPRLRRLARLSAYTFGYVLTNQAGLWVTLVLANEIQGGVAAREAAFVLFQLPHGLLAVSISMAVATVLTERAVAGDLSGFGEHLSRGLRGITFVALPAAAGYLAIAPEIVRLLLQHGVATASSTDLIEIVLRGYAVGLLFFSCWHLLLAAFQGLGDTRTPMLINLGGFVVQVALALTLFNALEEPRLRIAGLAVAHAGSYLAVAAAGIAVLRRRVGGLSMRPLLATFARAAVGALAAGAAARAVADASGAVLSTSSLSGQVPQILLAVGAGLLTYAAAAKVFRLEELGWVTDLVTRRLLRRTKRA